MAPLAHTCGYASKPEPVSEIPQIPPKNLLDTHFKAFTPDAWPSLPWLLPLCEYSQCMVLSLAPPALLPRCTLFSPSPIASQPWPHSIYVCSGLLQMHLAVLAPESNRNLNYIMERSCQHFLYSPQTPCPARIKPL